MKSNLLLQYLQSARQYGPRAGRINESFCKDVLGIDTPQAAITTLQSQGHRVAILKDGSITLQNEAMQ